MTAIAIDTETTGAYFKHGCRPFMVSYCDEDENMGLFTFEVDPFSREVTLDKETCKRVRNLLIFNETWVFHNAIFDLQALSYIFSPGELKEVLRTKMIHDTMLMGHCHNSLDRLGLKGLALQYVRFPEADEKHLHSTVIKARRIAKKLGWAIAEPDHPTLIPLKGDKVACDYWLPSTLIQWGVDVPPEVKTDFILACGNYALGDVQRTMALYMYFDMILREREDYHQYLQNMKCILPLWDMQESGLHLNRRRLPNLIRTLDQTREGLVTKLRMTSGSRTLNPNSGNQVRGILYDKMGIPPKAFTKAGAASADKDTLKDLLLEDLNPRKKAFIKYLLSYRKLTTASSYLESYSRFEHGGRLYTSINPTGTSTTRCSSRNPNAQNISKQENDEDWMDLGISINLRGAFGPPKGHLWVCVDYAQLQLRIFAHACEDEYLLNAFKEGLDIHDTVARKVFRTDEPSSLQRRAAKAINFGIIFGAGKRKIERMSGVEGSYDEFKRQFPLVDRYLKLTERQAKKMGYVRTLGGYPLRVPKATAYKACNYIVQGTEGELVKKAICDVTAYCNSEVDYEIILRPVMTIHDEIIFETYRQCSLTKFKDNYFHEIEDISRMMNSAAKYFTVDTEVDAKIVTNVWSSSQPVTVTE